MEELTEMKVKRSKRRARVYPSLESYEEAVYGEVVSKDSRRSWG